MSTQRVPLHDVHAELGARFTPFAGFEMPILFSGIIDEHEAVRGDWGIFDVSHMSNLDVPLDDGNALATAIAWDVTQLETGQGKYTVACRDDGTILDDLIVYRLDDRYHVVPNAAMNGPVGDHIAAQGAHVLDRSSEVCIIAVQGPNAPKLGPPAVGIEAPPRRFRSEPLDGGFAAGTGYTGEAGFELFVENDHAEAAWRALLDAGATPCGLGARDTLRLEKGYALAGNEFDPPRTPAEANLMWAVDMDHAFVGRDAVQAVLDDGPAERLVGLECTERGIPRRDHPVMSGDARVGTVSSGTQSPSLGHGIALAYVNVASADAGTELAIEVRKGRTVACRVTKPPFL